LEFTLRTAVVRTHLEISEEFDVLFSSKPTHGVHPRIDAADTGSSELGLKPAETVRT
jgi:hypothetical protein